MTPGDDPTLRSDILAEVFSTFDKGYFSSKNYQLGVLNYKIVPLIFPRNNLQN